MKGIVFNLLEGAVVSAEGEDAWDDLLLAAQVEGAYTSVGSYPDEELKALIAAGAARAGVSDVEFTRWFARESIPRLARIYPGFFEGHTSTRGFLLTLNDIIHTEVRKLYPGADVPVFEYEALEDGRLSLAYRSRRKLCAFAEGLIEGAARHFSETVTLEQPECMNRGDDRCVLVCAFGRG